MHQPTNLQKHSEGRFERLHHEAGAYARAANAAAGLAARRLSAGDLAGARGARIMFASHRSRSAVAGLALREELVYALDGVNLTRYCRREVHA